MKNKFDETKNNFLFKLNIFNNKCKLISYILDIYLKSVFVILTK